MVSYDTIVLGAGVTGLAAGMASGFPVFETREVVGGICASYYMRPGKGVRLPEAPESDDAYRFEYGGGHWIFGGDATVLHFVNALTPVRTYHRKSAVYFPEDRRLVPYPLQHHLAYLGDPIATKVLNELTQASQQAPKTMAEWLEGHFGPTLMALFFAPFHQCYTAGLWTRVAPQDPYKSPGNLGAVMQGASHRTPVVGYNATFAYPLEGLNVLMRRMAELGEVHCRKRVARIEPRGKVLELEDGTRVRYERLLSTIALNRMCQLTGLSIEEEPDPYTSVLVINIGALRGPQCPGEHWLYVASSRSGFHRVGFYSNVDRSFLPRRSRPDGDRVSLYVEKAYLGGHRPSQEEVAACCQDVIEELQAWGFIDQVEVLDPTWIDVAYTWSWTGSSWKSQALQALQAHDLYQVGRYGRWVFQGLADSIRDGFVAGSALRHASVAKAVVAKLSQ